MSSGFNPDDLAPIVTRVRRAEEQQGAVGPDDRVRVRGASGERLSNDLHKTGLGGHGHIQFGRIAYAVPGLHWYRVTLDEGSTDIGCCRGTECATQPLGVRDTSVLPPGTCVLVWVHAHALLGYILCTVPDIVTDGNKVHPDWISQGSNIGYKREAYYTAMYSLLNREAGMVDFSDNRPMDSSALGEWGRLSDLGGGFFLDPFMAFVRMNEVCGLWLHYFDSLTRLSGWNLDIRSSISEETFRNDEGEGDHYRGFTGYPWEALGLFRKGGQAHRETSDVDVQYNRPLGKYEPLVDDQQALYRFEEFHGYCGQGYMRQVSLLPEQDEGVYRYSGETARAGVFREQIGYEGAYALQAAHSIIIAKRTIIPVAKRIKLHEDKRGDSAEGEEPYKFAGIYGDEGPEHKVNDIKVESELPSLRTIAGMLDYHAHAFNWKGLHPFHYHAADYYTPDEDAVHSQLGSLQIPLNFTELYEQMWMSAPTARRLYVDHRYGEVDYYETTAAMSMLPDGSMDLRDGYASSMSMTGGNMTLSPPGDLILRPGRSLIIYAGDDIILRANKSIDATANKGDVRIKAEVNVDILGGNNGRMGRVLIESQADGIIHGNPTQQGEDVVDSGVILKARKSEVIAWGADVYLRTGGGNVRDGDIVLDASKGKRDIRTTSRVFNRHVEAMDAVAFPSSIGKQAAVQITPKNAHFSGATQFLGGAVVNGSLICNGNVAVKGGHIATELAATKNAIFVAPLEGDGMASVVKALSDADTFQIKLRNAMNIDYITGFIDRWHAYPKAGSDGVMQETEFAPRNDEQLHTKDFKIPTTVWQQLILAQGGAGKWKENPIIYHGETMLPHPGKAKWLDEATLFDAAPQLFDPETGRDKPRGADYEDVTFSDWSKHVPDDYYPVISI